MTEGTPVDAGRPGADGRPEVGLVPGVPEWRTTGTLTALQELVEVSETVPRGAGSFVEWQVDQLRALGKALR